MPAMLPAAVGASALGTGAAVGAGIGAGTAALGTGIAAGSALAGGAGIFSNFMAGAAPGLAGTIGGVSAPVAASIAPAATSQLMGTIGGSVAPGAFGANLAGAAAPGLTGTVGSVAPGAFGANLATAGQGLASTLPGAANPTLAQQIAAAQNQANLTRQAMGAKDIIGGAAQQAPQAGNLAETIRNTNTAMRGNVPISYAEGAQGIAPNAFTAPASNIQPGQNFIQNLGNIGSFQDVKDYAEVHPYATSAMAGLGAMGITKMLQPKKVPEPEDESMIRPYTYTRTQRPEAYGTSPTMDSSERSYFNDQFVAGEPYKAAEGGIAAAYAVGGPVEQMAAMNAVGANTGYPMANLQTPVYANPAMQRPEATNVIAPSVDAGVGAYSGEQKFASGGPAFMGPTQDNSPPQGPAFMGPVGSGYIGAGNYNENARIGGRSSTPTTPLPKYTYDPKTMQFTQTVGGNKVSGGIASPAAMPAIQPAQTAPTYPALNIPAYQSPEQQLGLGGFYDMMNQQLAGYGGFSGYAKGGNVGGESHLGDYSDGGRLLKGPGDGVSDSIPASIGGRQPARLADGEFVVPARIVSELGNGSTEAGARKLYAMMERVQASRRKSIGKKKVAVNSKADKHLPA